MKILFGILILLTISSCSNRETESSLPVSSNIDIYDTLIDQVKSQGAIRISRISMEHIKWEKFPKADLSFVKGVMAKSVNNNDTLPADSLSVYHVYDFSELDTLFLFSIARCDFSGYTSLYHFTFNKHTKKLTACTLIGTSREIEGNRCNDKLTFAKDNRSLIANSDAEIIEDGKKITDQCSIRYDFYNDSTSHKLLHNVHREKPLKM